MSDPEFWAGLVLLAMIVFFTTAAVAIRHLSRVQLSERLEKRGRSELLERLSRHRD